MLVGTKIDWVGHLLEILALGGVAKTISLRLDVVGVRLDHPGREGAMIDSAVITLRIVLDGHFPVALLVSPDGLKRRQIVNLRNKLPQFCLNTRKPVLHRIRIVIKIDKDEAAEFLRADRRQADTLSHTFRYDFGIGSTQKMTVKTIGPGMVRTDQRFLALTLS